MGWDAILQSVSPSCLLHCFFGRQGNTQEKHWHTMLSLPEHKGKHFSLEFGLQRLIGGVRITMGKRSDQLSVG